MHAPGQPGLPPLRDAVALREAIGRNRNKMKNNICFESEWWWFPMTCLLTITPNLSQFSRFAIQNVGVPTPNFQ